MQGGGPAQNQMPLNADAAGAYALAIQALQAAGANVEWQAPPQGARFELTRRDFMTTGGVKVRYNGELTIIQNGPRQSTARISLKLHSSSLSTVIVIDVVCVLLLGYTAGILLLLGLGLTAWQVWTLSTKVPQEMAGKLLMSISNGYAGAPAPEPAPLAVTPQARPAAPASGNVMEQLRQLAELRSVGAVTNEEFEAKKAELLRRL